MWPRRLIPAATASVAVLVSALAAAPAYAFLPEVMNSVVSVLPVWPGYENRQSGSQKPGEEPEGTAVAIADGFHLVTSLHVVGRATRIDVRFADGRKLAAKMVRRVTTDLIAFGAVRRGRIGVRLGNPPRSEKRSGALVTEVMAGGAAAAGLRAGDMVTAIDSPTTGSRAIRSASDMTAAVYLHRIGDEIRMTVWRDNAARKFRLRLGE
jgi:S1-C subfamily serine protease